jgi:hypothetical protein
MSAARRRGSAGACGVIHVRRYAGRAASAQAGRNPVLCTGMGVRLHGACPAGWGALNVAGAAQR